MSRRRVFSGAAVLGMLALASGFAAGASPKVDVFVTQVTDDPHVLAGEGYVMPDPTHPGTVTIVWLATSNVWTDPSNATYGYCGTAWTDDGGRTWRDAQHLPEQEVLAAGESVSVSTGRRTLVTCGDPVGGVGPDGTVYTAATALGSPSWTQGFTSHDHGSHWAGAVEVLGVRQELNAALAPENYAAGNAKTPAAGPGRAWMDVDPVTGAISVQSQEDGGAEGRWMVVSHDQGATWTAPHPLDPDVQGGSAGPHAVLGGLLALTYTVDPSSPTYLTSPAPAVTCSAKCLVFETSNDDGQSWQRHVVEKADGAATTKFTAADPTDPMTRHFAVLLTTGGAGSSGPGPGAGTKLELWTTPDAGLTWQQHAIARVPSGDADTFIKAGLDYAPDGTLGAVWRTQHGDGSYDVWAATSADDGTSWTTQKLTSTPAPAESAPIGIGDDCSCNVGLTDTTLYTVWGDERSGNRELWFGAWPYAKK